jgi:ubiquinone/menaquinone biosynthesis C-methylase UbiE
MSTRVDYDSIAPVYDQGRYREKSCDPQLRAFLAERDSRRPIRVLDICCGTGAQLAANRREWPELVYVGLDASLEMLRVAWAREPEIRWLRGDAAVLPLAGASFDYVSNQFALHHVRRKREFLAEVARVLRPGGRFVIRNLDPWSMPGWALYRYFPAAQERDLRDFMPVEEIVEILREVGLQAEIERRHWTDPVTLGDLAADIRKRRDRSQLIALSDDEYAAGLARVEADLRRLGPDAPQASEKCDVTFICDRR